jgi:hypothetical protein
MFQTPKGIICGWVWGYVIPVQGIVLVEARFWFDKHSLVWCLVGAVGAVGAWTPQSTTVSSTSIQLILTLFSPHVQSKDHFLAFRG